MMAGNSSGSTLKKKKHRLLKFDSPLTTFLKILLEQTDVSGPPLFQQELYKKVESTNRYGEQTFEKTLKGKTPDQRMFSIRQMLRESKSLNSSGGNNLLEQQYKPDKKCDTIAMACKLEGDDFLEKMELSEALRSYTKASMQAESVNMLVLAYNGRSSVLFQLELYQECVIDIERVYSMGYQDVLEDDLANREMDAKEKLKEMAGMPPVLYHEEVPILPADRKNPTIPCATNSIEVRSARIGQKVVATKTIEIGDIVAVEEPLIAIIDDGYLYHCHECFKLCYNPIPCGKCTQALYCSLECRKSADQSYHEFECPILLSLRKLLGSRINLAMAVKMLLQSEARLPVEMRNLMLAVQHEKFEEQVQLELFAVVMHFLVKDRTEKFTAPRGVGLERVFLYNIIALLQVCLLQTSGITELCPLAENVEKRIPQEMVAKAIYPFYAKFRHACEPNVYPYHYGVKRVVRAIRTIKRGEELLVSYGPRYTESPTCKRLAFLHRHYHFCCKCRACANNWEPANDESVIAIMAPNDCKLLDRMKEAPDVELVNRRMPEIITRLQILEIVEAVYYRAPIAVQSSEETSGPSTSKETSSAVTSEEPNVASTSDKPSVVLSSEERSVDSTSAVPSVALASAEPSDVLSSKETNVAATSEEASGVLKSAEPSDDLTSEKPSVDLTSAEPSVVLKSEEPSVDLTSEESNVTLPSEEPSVVLSSKETSVAVTSEETSGVFTSEGTSVDLTSAERSVPLEPEEPSVDLTSAELSTALGSEEPSVAPTSEESKLPSAAQRDAPRIEFAFLQKLLMYCYDVLGNKRQIQ